MMDVRIVLMAVAQGSVIVRMRVRLGSVPGEIVLVAVMLVVLVSMQMGQGMVLVRVPVTLREMQRYTGGHQNRREPEQRIRPLAEQSERHCRSDKGGSGEIRAGPSGAELPQAHHE